MNIQANTPPVAPRQSSNASFNYNAQDPDTLPADTTTIANVDPNGGHVQTDTLLLSNKKAIFILGQLVGFKQDPKYTLSPDQNGNFNYAEGTPSFTGGQAFGAVASTIEKYNAARNEVAGKSIEWSFGGKQLLLSPETGEWPNAFYARQQKGVHFFDYKTTSTGNSGEVASHETGHAILDALRSGYMEGSGSETGAFHEAFGDCLAMLMTLQNDNAADGIIAQTEGGDLSTKRNMLSDMGEDFGHELGKEGGIRTAFNSFTYQDPATLPEQGDETHLGREVHDFARLWAGAFYDVLDGISDANRAAGMSPKEALKAAGEEGLKLLVGQIENSANSSETTFKEMAVNLLAADAQNNGGARQQVIHDVMEKRALLPENATPTRLDTRLVGDGVRNQSFTFGADAGELAGVKMTSRVGQPTFGIIGQESTSVTGEAEKGARLMAKDGNVLFTDHTPTIGELFRADGTAYSAYVAPNAKGEQEFHKALIAF